MMVAGTVGNAVRSAFGNVRKASKSVRFRRKWLILLLPLCCIAGSAALLTAARFDTDFAEWYAARVYPALVRTVGGFWSLFPFSAGEFVVYGLALTAGVWMARLCYLLAAGKRRRMIFRMIRRSLAGLTMILSVILLLFTLNCGINYHRVPFSAFSGLEIQPATVEELYGLGQQLVQETNTVVVELNVSDSGATRLQKTPRELSRAAAETMRALGARYSELNGWYPNTKPVLFSHGMSYLNITGIFFPPTIEANINVDVPDYSIPATACHELSHLRGFMREDEANFIAFLACRESADPEFQYSGYMMALSSVLNALRSADGSLHGELCDRMDQRLWTDYNENNAYWKEFEGPVAEISDFANDTYLKANAQADGVKSYGRMVDLLIADYRRSAFGESVSDQ